MKTGRPRAGPTGCSPRRSAIRTRPRCRRPSLACASCRPSSPPGRSSGCARSVAEAQAGRRFLLQGGDCAETLADCQPDVIARKLKILLQMSLVLIHGGQEAGHPGGAVRRAIRQAPLEPDRVARRRGAAQLLRRPGQPAGVHARAARVARSGAAASRATCTPGSPSTSSARCRRAASPICTTRSSGIWPISPGPICRRSCARSTRSMVRQLAEALRFMEALGRDQRRRAHPGRVLHQPRGAVPALRGGPDQDRPAARPATTTSPPTCPGSASAPARSTAPTWSSSGASATRWA